MPRIGDNEWTAKEGLNNQQLLERLQNRPDICPYCGSYETYFASEADPEDLEEEQTRQITMKCEKCFSKWEEFYDLSNDSIKRVRPVDR